MAKIVTSDYTLDVAMPQLESMSDDEFFSFCAKVWRKNGVRLGWLIDPKKRETFIYRINGTINKVEGFNNILFGEDVLPGFELNLTILT